MRSFIALLLLAAFALPSRAASPGSNVPARDSYTVECVFTNPAYSGPCAVSEETSKAVTPREACKRVLACLNNAQCVTKTYCNATSVRGGWVLTTARRQPAKRSE